MKDKFILDVTCGGRTIWFNKNHPNVLYTDIRREDKGFCKARPNFEVQPDKIMDFRDLKLNDESFKMVVWDPPHMIKLGQTSELRRKYGGLNVDRWRSDLRNGFKECWRVLERGGVLVFKWNERDIPLKEVLKCFDREPLFGHTSGSKSQTKWLCFMKLD